MKTSIIIATHNKLEYTQLCIESIREFTSQHEYEIIVVDNHSTDETATWLRTQTDIKTIWNNSNLGFPKACNQGIEICTGDNILLLNNDTIVTENWLTNLLNCLYSSEEVGAAGSLTNYCSYGQAIEVPYKSIEEMFSFAAQHNQNSNPGLWEERLKLVGYCMIMKKKVLDEVGLLDERFTPGNFEDDDLSLRIRLAGYKLFLCRDTFIHHFGSTSFKDNANSYNQLLHTNQKKFLEKWGFEPSAAVIHDKLVKQIDAASNDPIRVLEVGSGCGGTLLYIKNQFPQAEVYGIEANDVMAKVTALVTPHVYLTLDELPNLFPEGFFNVIIVGNLGGFDENSYETINALKKYINEHGQLIANVPNLFYYRNVKKMIEGTINGSELRNWKLSDVDQAFKAAGYLQVEITGLIETVSSHDQQFMNRLAEMAGSKTTKLYEVRDYSIMARKCDKGQIAKKLINNLMLQENVEYSIKKISKFDTEVVLAVIEDAGQEQVKDLLNFVGVQFIEHQKPDMAIPYLSRAFEHDENYDPTLFNLGLAMYLQGHDQLALDWLSLISKRDDKLEYWIKQIETELLAKSPKIHKFTKVIQSVEELPIEYGWYDKLNKCIAEKDNKIQAGLLQEIVQNEETVITYIDNHVVEKVEVLNSLATICYTHGYLEHVIPFLQVALTYDETNSLTLENIANALNAFGEPRMAAKYLDKVLIKNKDILNYLEEIKKKIVYTVSIIIPVYNKVEYTKQCLEAIINNTVEELYEVIVIDNASTDGTSEYLNGLPSNVKVIKNELNAGFVGACNQGASVASGKYLVFLNNDTVPVQGWLENLVSLADSDPTIGIVGAMLVYPNGTLQEAGGIIWDDGSGWNYGRGDDPQKPMYNFVREVDYCSGACLMIGTKLFNMLGGFDERYAPGYYEDTDLCFAAREAGYKVMYQPKAIVLHFEGISSGTDLSQGMKRYQVINQKKFVDKWRSRLNEQYPPSTRNVLSASIRNKGKKILIVDPYLPMYDRASGSLRLYNIIKILLKHGHFITYIARNGIRQEKYIYELQTMGVEVFATDVKKMEALGYNVSGLNIDMELLLKSRHYDVAWLSFYDVAEQYLDEIRLYSPKTIIFMDTVDVHFIREMRMAEINNDQQLKEKAKETKEREIKIYSKCDTIITVTENDGSLLLKENSKFNIKVIPNIHNNSHSQIPFLEREHLLFVGNFNHTPNVDAVNFFLSTIWPKVKSKLPEIKFYIVGNKSDQLTNISDPNIIVTGYVESVEPYLKKCKVSVAPLRYGAGMKGKIGEAMMSGLPVVTTAIGAEGMGLLDGVHLLIREEASDFADAIIDLYNNEELWNILSQNSIKYIEKNYSSRVVETNLKNMIVNT
ncbi:glycosyltransferase [Paenibacillus elgii]|uniref:glycosyltransferase n=1 Tax=Paenibacillus elgii TaxID=189691 RepID=UPI0013CFD944|nr:glycosyltransferase [Paenibacillus elgii]